MSNLKLKSALVTGIFSAGLLSPIGVLAAVPDYISNITPLTSYLEDNQDTDGKITGFGGETSWSIMGMVAAGVDPSTVENGGNSLLDFLADNPPADTATTAWERDLLAITAAGENPFTFGGRNYVEKVESFANSGQIGSLTTLNDDIFGILSLVSAGPSVDQQIISDSVDFLIANQNTDGGWSWSVGGSSDTNDTAVAIQALKSAQTAGFSNVGITDAISDGTNHLLSLQQPDGGWEYQPGFGTDGASTAWVVQALIGEDVAVTNGLNFLVSLQDSNGGIQYQAGFGADTFTSGYALSAFAQTPFPINIFDEVVESEPDEQPDIIPDQNQNQDDGGDVLSASTDTEGEVLAEVLPETGIVGGVAESSNTSTNPNDTKNSGLVPIFLFGLVLTLLGVALRHAVVRVEENKVS